MNEAAWVSGQDYSGPGKWADTLRDTGRLELPTVKPARKRATARPVASPVCVTRVDPEALREALKLAQGDASRLSFLSDGSVIVGNVSKRRKVEHP